MNEQLEQLEIQLAEMSLGKKIAIYVLILLSIVYMSWYNFGEDMSVEIETKEANIVSLENKLQKNSIKSLNRAITKAKKEVLKYDEELTTLNFKNQYIRSRLESIGFIFYDEKGMAKILDDTLKSSLKNKIDISVIESTIQNKIYVPYIYVKESINVKGCGSFKSIMSLIQYIDSFKALLKIDAIVVEIDKDQTKFDLNISRYGVEL